MRWRACWRWSQLLAIAAIFGLTSWCGLPLDIGSAIAAPVALAIVTTGRYGWLAGSASDCKNRKVAPALWAWPWLNAADRVANDVRDGLDFRCCARQTDFSSAVSAG